MNKSFIINEIKSYLNIKTDSDFADFLGVKQPTISTWRKRNTIDYELIIAKCDNINGHWLLTGQGPMLKNTGNISIGGDNKGIANTGVIAGDSNITINSDISPTSTETNTEDIKDLLSSYNVDKSVEINLLQATMLESKDAIIEEKNSLIQELKEQIQELREDKKHLKSLLDKGNN